MRPLAKEGNVHAQARLAFLYANGEGVAQDYAAAVGWYRKAAEQGNAIAQYNLGDMYRVGEGVPRTTPPRRAGIAKRPSRATRVPNNLEFMYDNGEGVGQDDVSAYMWFNLATANGFKEAVKDRDMVGRRMTPAKVAEARSRPASGSRHQPQRHHGRHHSRSPIPRLQQPRDVRGDPARFVFS